MKSKKFVPVPAKFVYVPKSLSPAEKDRLMKNAVEMTGIEWDVVTQRFHDEMEATKRDANMKPWELWGDSRKRSNVEL